MYFIFSKELLYIGETQKITFSRWVQHFYKNGTFTQKVQRYGYAHINYFSNIHLLSVELITLQKDFEEIRWKTLTQAIEHSLHEHLQISQTGLIKSYYEKYQPDIERYRIISDTTRTAPTSIPQSEWDYARSYGRRVLDEIYQFF